MVGHLFKSALNIAGFDLKRSRIPRSARGIPGASLYNPLYSPWLGDESFLEYYNVGKERTLVSPDRCYVLYTLLRQVLNVPGDIFECGVFRGGTAAMTASFLAGRRSAKRLYLFDTFGGMPETDTQRDLHKKGDFSETDVETVRRYVAHPSTCIFRKGFIPATFNGLEDVQVAMAHIDVDIYRSILDSLEFIWPRLSTGGFVVFDDYGFASCPGARLAVDEFFAGSSCVPLCLPTGQALAFKSVST